MDMNNIVALIAALGGTAGLVTAISSIIFKVIDYKKQKKGDTLEKRLQPLIDELSELRSELHEVRLDTIRTQLYFKITHEPHNHDTILRIADKYFVTYHGDWVATADFQEWADKEKLNIPAPILEAIAKNHDVL